MFEHFTPAARRAVSDAHREGDRLQHAEVGTEHLLLGLLHDTEDPCVAVLTRHGLDLPTARAAVVRLLGGGTGEVDAEALGHIGIDLTAVREAVEAGFGPGALDGPPGARDRRTGGLRTGRRTRFSDRARKALELSVRAALARRSKVITSGHLLVALFQEAQQPSRREQRQSLLVRLLTDHGLVPATVYAEVLTALDG
ncbi:Clp protease N-terminal domain-containing protein [Kitasatospora sp. LaBMicrA B282]|uniref:Clp protease N-terminal domain-containing protein n=1 Tax=Kitasatospora sp. LaBMicrA B282 TaxID=3420949 RepID=UPI003D144F8A